MSNLKRSFATIAILTFQIFVCEAINNRGNNQTRQLNIPEWKQRACEKSQAKKASSHYHCDEKGNVKCLPGWQGDLCQVPMCRRGCDPMNGYCQRPGECRCRIGYTGELCEKCIPLPGCQHGYCNKPFECLCKPGWDGLFCTEPTCREGCHSTRGYCEEPGECRCRIGWAGRNCSDCSVLPGCVHGTCVKPLECQCLPGYVGLLCQTAICSTSCHKQHGYCRKPGECRCKVGWTGENCDKCFPYPGCVNGDCRQPWECNCKPGWTGILCDEKAEIEVLTSTSTAVPRITAPPLLQVPLLKESTQLKENIVGTTEKFDNDQEEKDNDDEYDEYEEDDDEDEDDSIGKSPELSNQTFAMKIINSNPQNVSLDQADHKVQNTVNGTTEVFEFPNQIPFTKMESLIKPKPEKIQELKDSDVNTIQSKHTPTNSIENYSFFRRSSGSTFVFPTM